MFDFSSPEQSLQMLMDARRAKKDGGPGVPNKPLDEQTIDELRCSLAYSFSVVRVARKSYGEEVTALAKAQYDEVWKLLIEADERFKKRVLKGKVQAPLGDLTPYQDFIRGKSSEL